VRARDTPHDGYQCVVSRKVQGGPAIGAQNKADHRTDFRRDLRGPVKRLDCRHRHGCRPIDRRDIARFHAPEALLARGAREGGQGQRRPARDLQADHVQVVGVMVVRHKREVDGRQRVGVDRGALGLGEALLSAWRVNVGSVTIVSPA